MNMQELARDFNSIQNNEFSVEAIYRVNALDISVKPTKDIRQS